MARVSNQQDRPLPADLPAFPNKFELSTNDLASIPFFRCLLPRLDQNQISTPT
jgi:hypothetical protein